MPVRRMQDVTFAQLLASLFLGGTPRPVAGRSRAPGPGTRGLPSGRAPRWRGRKYDGPRDPKRRRPAITTARLRALNVAWNTGAAAGRG